MALRDEILADSPAIFLEMDENSGTTIADSSGNSNDFTLSGAALPGDNASSIPNGSNRSIRLNDGGASGDRLQLTGYTLASGDTTVEIWMDNIQTLTNNFRGIFNYNSQLQLYTANTGAPNNAFRFTAGGASANFPSVTVDQTQPAMILVTWRQSDGRAQLWINGVNTGTINVGAGGSFTGPGTFHIGFHPGQNELEADYDYFSVYNSVLSDARIGAHWDAGEFPLPEFGCMEPSVATVDLFPPIIQNPQPAAATVLGINDAIAIDISEDKIATLEQTVAIDYTNEREVVHDGTAFVLPYFGTVTDVGNVRTVSFQRNGGWKRAAFTERIVARDDNNKTPGSYAYTVSPDPLGVPTITFVDPTPGNDLGVSQQVSISVEDATGPVTTQILAIVNGQYEVIYDAGFTPKITGTATTVGNVTTYAFERTGGWGAGTASFIVGANDGDAPPVRAVQQFNIDVNAIEYPPRMRPYTVLR